MRFMTAFLEGFAFALGYFVLFPVIAVAVRLFTRALV